VDRDRGEIIIMEEEGEGDMTIADNDRISSTIDNKEEEDKGGSNSRNMGNNKEEEEEGTDRIGGWRRDKVESEYISFCMVHRTVFSIKHVVFVFVETYCSTGCIFQTPFIFTRNICMFGAVCFCPSV